MKKIRSVILALALACVSASAAEITLEWSYPTAEIQPNLAFVLYTSPTLPTSRGDWVKMVQVTPQVQAGQAQSKTQYKFTMAPGEAYFMVTALDTFWLLESDPSNSAGTPKPVVIHPTGQLTIQLTKP